MHSYYFSTLATLLHEMGVDDTLLLRNTGLQYADILEALTATTTQLDTVCCNALELTGDRQLGLKLGARINILTQGIFGYALLTSSTVDDALKLLVRYNRAILPSIDIELEDHAGTVSVLVQATHLPIELERFYCEVLYAAMISSGRILLGNQTTQFMLELDYEPPYDRALYHEVFGTSVNFSSAHRALRFEEGSLGLAISSANPVAQDIFRRECDRLSSGSGTRGLVNERVQQVLLQTGSEFPTGAAVARQLHMSESTLQRRLAKEGYRFQQVLDQVRYRLAEEYLRGTSLPVAEIASLLGFSDATNFRRSFRRWSNTTPSALRRASEQQRSG